SAGGDSRVVGGCLNRYQMDDPSARFHCVITALGFEDEREHITNAVKIAERFDLPYTVFSSAAAAELLHYQTDLNSVARSYKQSFPSDEPEVLGTYWVQQINVHVAHEAGRRGIVFGYNQEDTIADRLYQLLSGKLLPTFPIRSLTDYDIIAPLCQIPKKMIDAMDLGNSLRNYAIRVPSVSYLRSSLYFIAYMICEKFPAVADVLSGSPLEGDDPDAILHWLSEQ
ncbi:MAG: hypothetical protein ACREGB_05300, partial [Candidatus Saccharimonadales bacterium]